MARRPNPSSGRTILCVDDQVEFLESTAALLERQGHRVLSAQSGAEALVVLEKEKVDLLLLDYFMPGLTAEEIIAGVRDPTLQVILLTGYSTEKPPREMMERLDIQGYCDKSRGPEELLLWVAVALRHGAVVRQLDASSTGLRQVLSSCLRPEEHASEDAEMDALLADAADALGLDNAMVALSPAQPTCIPPSRLEEESDFWDPQGAPDLETLRVAAATGSWIKGESLESQVGFETARAVLRAPRRERSSLPGGIGSVPLRAEGRWLGCLLAHPSPPMASPQAEILSFFARQIANACLVRQGATIDSATGLQSRRFWREIAMRELRQSFRFGHPVGLVSISIEGLDDLRARKPRHADAVLERVGKLLGSVIRGSDLAGRGEEDEVLLLLSHTGSEGGRRFAERLSHRLGELVLPYPERHLARGALGLAALEPHAFAADLLPRPMPKSYYPEVERTLRGRATERRPAPDEGSAFRIWIHPEVSWPDPREMATRRGRANFLP